MNVITSTNLRNNLSDSIKEVATHKSFLLVAKKGKVTTALVDIDYFEDLLAMTNKSYKKSIQQARQEYQNGEVMTHTEVFGDIGRIR